MALSSFGYRALDRSGREQTGVVEASSAADAAEKVRTLGLSPTAVRKGESPPPPVVPDARPRGVPGRAELNVRLVLLQAIEAGADEVVFDCGAALPQVQYRACGNWHPLLAPAGAYAEGYLDALGEMSGAPELGRGKGHRCSVLGVRSGKQQQEQGEKTQHPTVNSQRSTFNSERRTRNSELGTRGQQQEPETRDQKPETRHERGEQEQEQEQEQERERVVVCVRATVDLHRHLPDAPAGPRKVVLDFRSFADAPGRVSIRIPRPEKPAE